MGFIDAKNVIYGERFKIKMATYYYMACNKCKKRSSISYARQAWGWGNCWPTNTFNFLIKHTRECGEENICCISDYNSDFYELDDENGGYELRGFEEP